MLGRDGQRDGAATYEDTAGTPETVRALRRDRASFIARVQAQPKGGGRNCPRFARSNELQ